MLPSDSQHIDLIKFEVNFSKFSFAQHVPEGHMIINQSLHNTALISTSLSNT